MTKFSKAIWAAISTAIASLTVAVTNAEPHTLSGVHTLGWLAIIGSVVAVTGGVYGFQNSK